MLRLLQALSLNLHPSIVEMWDTVIPKLTQYLEGKISLANEQANCIARKET